MTKEIVPPRFLTKKEQDELREKLEEMGLDGIEEELINKGWSPESAKMLARAIFPEGKR